MTEELPSEYASAPAPCEPYDVGPQTSFDTWKLHRAKNRAHLRVKTPSDDPAAASES